jgi:hypothetical protein
MAVDLNVTVGVLEDYRQILENATKMVGAVFCPNHQD